MKVQNLNRRQAQYVLYLSRFNFTLKHIPGIKIEKVNKLSKKPDWKVGVENNNNNQTLIKGQLDQIGILGKLEEKKKKEEKLKRKKQRK